MRFTKILKYFFISVFSIGFIFSLSSCSSTSDDELYEKNYYTETSESELIKQRSLRLIFNVADKTISGTGWIWSKSGDYYYVATNLHVANSISFINNTFINGNNDKINDYSNIKNFSSAISYATSLNSITPEFSVDNPVIIYTTLMDNDYDLSLNGDSRQYYINENSYYGVTDICILRYYFPTNENNFSDEIKKTESSYNNFIKNWINNFDEDKIQILDDQLNLSNYSFYSGGFPKQNNSIEWKPVSNFTFNKKVTDSFSPLYSTLNKPNNDLSGSSTLITFIDHNYRQNSEITDNYYSEQWYTNYLNVSYTGYFYGHSDEGASGSMLVAKKNEQLYIVGIYWGISNFEMNNKDIKSLGSFDIFVNEKYNIVKGVNNLIEQDINSLK